MSKVSVSGLNCIALNYYDYSSIITSSGLNPYNGSLRSEPVQRWPIYYAYYCLRFEPVQQVPQV